MQQIPEFRNSDPKQSVDLAFIAEGYRTMRWRIQNEVRYMADALFAEPHFSDYVDN
jgi:hypothetical protein